MKSYRQIDGYYIKEDEEFLIKDIVPDYYIDLNIGRNLVDVEYAARFLQNSLNYLLSSFLNGGFSYKGYMLYPFVKGLSRDNLTRIRRLKKVAVLLNNDGYDFSSSIGKYKDKINSGDFASILSALYHDFSLIENRNKIIKKKKCRELNISSYKKSDLNYLKPLNELKDYANKNLKQHLSGFYLHGSLSTRDYMKGWSDVDTLSVISRKAIDDPDALLSLRDRLYFIRHFFYKIDPLQHHGSAVISEYDLGNYCQAYFPIKIFEYSKSFFKDDAISKLVVRDFSSEALKNLFWFVNYFRKLKIEKRFRLGSYESKALLHSITLFPTLYLQSKGILTYKKFSFGIAKRDFIKSDWEVIEKASSIRSNWKSFGIVPLITPASRINPLLCYQLNSRLMDIFNKPNKVGCQGLIENMLRLSEKAWGKVKENAKRKI